MWERPLILSTIHSAKGLEWRNVFLIGAIDGVLPSSYSTHDDEELEEEHRLLYVAVTRARERLYVLAHHEGYNNGIHTFNRLSRFIEAANVKALLDQKITSGFVDEGNVQPLDGYSKADLLTKLLDSMK
jgi:DNA helicase-2/ATP-dependent DNA helicase PcrA